MERLRESGSQQTGLQTQATAAEMARLERQLVGASEQQAAEIRGQMERLVVSGSQQQGLVAQQGELEQRRITLQANIETALQSSANDQQLQRMGAEFAQQATMQGREQGFAMERLAASGNQELARLAAANAAENERLGMSIAAGDRQAIAASTVNIFQAEAQMRAALLSNASMPATERSAYEQAISQMGAPARNFINQLYTQAPAGLNAGGAIPATSPQPAVPAPGAPPAMIAPGAFGTNVSAPTGLNAGGAVDLARLPEWQRNLYGQVLAR